jgi:hypothetical protein
MCLCYINYLIASNAKSTEMFVNTMIAKTMTKTNFSLRSTACTALTALTARTEYSK